jgi:hypothetical protein
MALPTAAGTPERAAAIAAVRADAPDVAFSDDPDLLRRRSTDRSSLLGPHMAAQTSDLVAPAPRTSARRSRSTAASSST